MLDESVCHFRGIRSIVTFSLFLMEYPVSKQCRLLEKVSTLLYVPNLDMSSFKTLGFSSLGPKAFTEFLCISEVL